MNESVRDPIPPAMLKELRHLLASAISDPKAYEVPALCRRLNLADGTTQEAFSSKYKYAKSRIAEISSQDVLESARLLLNEETHFQLSEQFSRIEELRGPQVSTLTRRRLIALFEDCPLTTEFSTVDLIRSVWPIAQMLAPAPNERDTVEDYILRYAFMENRDIPASVLFESLGIQTCSRKQFFKFLEAVTAPDAQSPETQATLVKKIDELLRKDGYTMALAGKMSGNPSYAVKQLPTGSPADESISAALAAFDSTQVHARWAAALDRRTEEPEGAITLARTLLEDVCKWILHQADENFLDSDDLPALYRKLAKVLKLAPDDHTEQVFKQILGSCQSVVESLGALRNKLGDAHSTGPIRARPHPRHAELAVNLAGAMATFLVSTWEARRQKQEIKS